MPGAGGPLLSTGRATRLACGVRGISSWPRHFAMRCSLHPGRAWHGGLPARDSAFQRAQEQGARDFVGKKVCVVGTSSSGFDTAYGCARLGINVTLFQRSPTYVVSLTHSVPRMLGAYAPDENGNLPDMTA
ncbi:uncharacterized protein BJX67DRAFT_352498 [Aspergillus lucknowensis]|uniref:Uncharacterized protein n=1 Tax=Aspergillus lucknowensis TaxID=176173 RepID=A0ABR4LSJ8_9EURO